MNPASPARGLVVYVSLVMAGFLVATVLGLNRQMNNRASDFFLRLRGPAASAGPTASSVDNCVSSLGHATAFASHISLCHRRVNGLAMDPGIPAVLHACGPNGVYKTLTGGETESAAASRLTLPASQHF